jgi:HSP20 family protein
MALARWTPMRNLASFQDETNRMFNEFFRGGSGEEAGWGVRTWAPPMDIYETDDALVLKAELPGVSKDDVSIEIHQNTLILRGQRQHEAEVKDEQYHRVQRAYGTFQRSFVLPTLVDQEHVQATYKEGCWSCACPNWKARNRGELRFRAKKPSAV